MSDEFDEIVEPLFREPDPQTRARCVTRASPSVPRLVTRLFQGSNLPLRARLIVCLLRPLGPLGLAGVAAGAFAGYLSRRECSQASVDLARAAQVSSEQIHELAGFVEQVNPQAFQRLAEIVAGSQPGLARFSASVLLLLYRALSEPA